MDEARKAWGLTKGRFVKLLLKLQEISFYVEGLAGSPNSKTFKQKQGVGTGGPESPAIFLMVLAWFLVAMKRYEEQNIEKDILDEEKKLLPVREIGFMDDLNFLLRNKIVAEVRLGFVYLCGPWCGFFLELSKCWGMCLWNDSKYAKGTSVQKVDPPTLDIFLPDGTKLKEVWEERVIGGWISRNQSNLPEIRRRHGTAWATIKSLKDVWKGSKIRRKTKIRRADSYAYNQFAFNFATLSLNNTEESRIRSFQSRVVRYVLKTPPVWIGDWSKRVRTRELRRKYQIKEWVDRIRNLRIKLCNKFLSLGPGAPQFDIIATPDALPWCLPGKKLNVGMRVPWSDLVRREVVTRGMMSWETFILKGRLGALLPERMRYEDEFIKSKGLKPWSPNAYDLKKKIRLERFSSQRKMRIQTEIWGKILRLNQAKVEFRSLHDPESWEYKFRQGTDEDMQAPLDDPTGLGGWSFERPEPPTVEDLAITRLIEEQKVLDYKKGKGKGKKKKPKRHSLTSDTEDSDPPPPKAKGKGKGKGRGRGRGKGRPPNPVGPKGGKGPEGPRQIHLHYLPPDEVDRIGTSDPALAALKSESSKIRKIFNFSLIYYLNSIFIYLLIN